MGKKIQVITCQALTHLIGPGTATDRVVLPICLHLNPNTLRETLNEQIAGIEETGGTILLGYGLCGRALEGVVSQKSRLVLPRVDDCVGAVLGSRTRHKRLSQTHSGCFFLEPEWMGTDIDIFTQAYKGLDRIPEESRDDIVRMAFKNYKKLALIRHGGTNDRKAVSRCRALAGSHGLKFAQVFSDLTLLKDLVRGQWDCGRFVLAEPGQKISFF